MLQQILSNLGARFAGWIPPVLARHFAPAQAAQSGVYDDVKMPALAPVDSYSTAECGNQYLRLRATQPDGFSHPWVFAHRDNAKAAVHVMVIVTASDGGEYVHFLIQKSPPFGMRPIVQLPAGLVGDKGEEAFVAAAAREVKEETGYDVVKVAMISDTAFATSPGMTDELKTFAVCRVTGKPSRDHFDGGEELSIVGGIDVPIETVRDELKFKAWIAEMNRMGYGVGMDVLAGRALLPKDF